jgi:hypothetical protein
MARAQAIDLTEGASWPTRIVAAEDDTPGGCGRH